MIATVVDRSRRIDYPPAAVVCHLDDHREVLLSSVTGPLQALDEDPTKVVENVRRKPQRELGRVDDDAEAIRERVAGRRRRRGPGPEGAIAASGCADQYVHVVDNRYGRR